MTCFRCGSEVGSETQACPACVSAVRDLKKILPSETIRREYSWSFQKVVSLILGDSYKVFVLIVAATLCLCYYLGVHRFLMNIFIPLPQRIERLCQSEAAIAGEAFKSQRPLSSGHLFEGGGKWERVITRLYPGEGGSRMMSGLRRGLQGMCLDIRKLCEEPDNRDACRQLVPNPLQRAK
jgi:hypothetical protein